MRDEDFIPWLDKVVALSLKGGESTTAHVLYVDRRQREIIVDVLASNHPYPGSEHRAFTIPFGRILSVYPAPDGLTPRRALPSPDLCRTGYSTARIRPEFIGFLLIFPGSLLPFFFFAFSLGDPIRGAQIASLVAYTGFVVYVTFGGARGAQPYLFTCPVVRRQLSGLTKRHICFLLVLFVLETAALILRPHMPASWLTASGSSRGRNMPPFDFALLIFGAILGAIQSFKNRSLLERAHLEFSPLDTANL